MRLCYYYFNSWKGERKYEKKIRGNQFKIVFVLFYEYTTHRNRKKFLIKTKNNDTYAISSRDS